MRTKHIAINFPFVIYHFLLIMIILLSIGLYLVVLNGEKVDTYSMWKIIVAALMFPFVFMLIFTFKTLINSEGITRLYGFVISDGSFIGIKLESEIWSNLTLENVSGGIDVKNKTFIIKEGGKREKIIIDLRSKKYSKFDSKKALVPGINYNIPKWFYGEKYIEKHKEQLRLIYKYGKDVSMTPLQAECWYNTFGPFDDSEEE